MTNKELLDKSAALLSKAQSISHPLLPQAIKGAIVGAAEIVCELVRREVQKDGS